MWMPPGMFRRLSSSARSSRYLRIWHESGGQVVFGSPDLEGKSVPSEWLIHFDFAQSGVVALPQQTAP